MTDYERGVEQASAVYKEVIREYVAENAKLREELEQWRRLTAGIELPEYPITEFKPKDLERENAKLRELVKKLVILAFARCADCDLLDASCALVPTQKCLLWNECESIARELGVEVDE